jgi:hypothetical protein
MSTGSRPRDDADLEAFLGRKSPVSTDYDNLELVEPPTTLDDRILAAAAVAAKSAPKSAPKPSLAPVAGKPAPTQPVLPPTAGGASLATPPDTADRRKRSRLPQPETDDDVDNDDDDDATPPRRRPPWLLPAALAASVLVALGAGFAALMNAPSGTSDSPLDGSLFAKRARQRSEEAKATAAASAQQDAEAVEVEIIPLPPPPVFEAEGSQVQDLDGAIVLIRKELLLADQVAASQESSNLANTAAPALADAVAPAAPGVVQPRERRLTKILELYDGGNPDLAGDSLAMFLRDFEDDPISKRILGVKP